MDNEAQMRQLKGDWMNSTQARAALKIYEAISMELKTSVITMFVTLFNTMILK